MTHPDAPDGAARSPAPQLPDRPVGWELLLSVLIFVLIVVVGGLTVAALADVAFGPGEGAGSLLGRGLPDAASQPQTAWFYLAGFALIYLSAIAAAWLAMFPHRGRRALALALLPAGWRWFVFGALAVVAASLAGDLALLPLLREGFGMGEGELQVTRLLRALTATAALTAATIVVVAILAPLAEELLFRGLLWGWMRAHLPFWATALITSALFGLAHGEAAHAIAAGVLGLVLAFIRERSRSLWPPIAAHVANNLIAVASLPLAL